MTLVVAQVVEDRISLISDTMITFGLDEATGAFDEEKTQDVFGNALPKLIILRKDLVIGMAGADLGWAARELVAMRGADPQNILDVLTEFDEVDFVLGSVSAAGPRLWRVSRREVDDRTTVGTAWIGHEPAYDVYRRLYRQWPPGMDTEFLMQSSMQGVINVYRAEFVGGYTLRVTVSTQATQFVATPTQLLGGSLAKKLAPADGEARLTGQPTAFYGGYLMAVGTQDTFGALGTYLPGRSLGFVFTHDEPWRGQRITAHSMPDFLRLARDELGQVLAA
ncbi:hypothetical protein [Longispora albida]|uniref:hypothetical protein n=1 Tax=Longispora albida TaxID=203523 RepID=UPI0003689020|nr:hypothetical protein [Longispora albida]